MMNHLHRFLDQAQKQVDALEKEWSEDPRWAGTRRDYTASDVVRLRGSYLPACSLARHGSEILW